MRREFGGCAGNIAYNLKTARRRAAAHGDGGQRRAAYLDKARCDSGISQRHVHAQIPDAYTAQAFITTDLDDNQITAFHPGR